MKYTLQDIENCSSIEALDKLVLGIIHTESPYFFIPNNQDLYSKTDIFYHYEQQYKSLIEPHYIKTPKENKTGINYTYGHDIDLMAPFFEKIEHTAFIQYDTDYFLSYAAQYGNIKQFKRAVDLLEKHERHEAQDFDYSYSLYNELVYPITDIPDNCHVSYKSNFEKFNILLNHYKKDMRLSKEQVWISEAQDSLYYYEDYKSPLSRILMHIIRDHSSPGHYHVTKKRTSAYKKYRENLFNLVLPHLTQSEITNLFDVLIAKNKGVDPYDKTPLLDTAMVDYVRAVVEATQIKETIPLIVNKITTKTHKI